MNGTASPQCWASLHEDETEGMREVHTTAPEHCVVEVKKEEESDNDAVLDSVHI